jgi:hypothetical protein
MFRTALNDKTYTNLKIETFQDDKELLLETPRAVFKHCRLKWSGAVSAYSDTGEAPSLPPINYISSKFRPVVNGLIVQEPSCLEQEIRCNRLQDQQYRPNSVRSMASTGEESANHPTSPRDSKGWDGKLRVDKKAVLANPEALSDPENSEDEGPPREEIEADEGERLPVLKMYLTDSAPQTFWTIIRSTPRYFASLRPR